MTVATTRLLIFCVESVRVQMNNTLNQIAPGGSGEVMRAMVALPSDPRTAVGRWTSWGMTDAQRSNVLKAYAQQGWRPLTGSEGKVHQPGDSIPEWGTQRFWMLDGDTWTSSDALSVLGLVAWESGDEE